MGVLVVAVNRASKTVTISYKVIFWIDSIDAVSEHEPH
jgi:hypothetical protein